MRPAALFISAAILLSCAAFAQTPDSRVAFRFTSGPKATAAVTNNSSLSIIGIAIALPRSEGTRIGWEMWFDSGVNFRNDPPIEKGLSRTLAIAPFPPEAEPQVKAIIFADGSSAGDPEWISRFGVRQQCAMDELKSVRATLVRAKDANLSIEEIAALLEQRRVSPGNGGIPPECRAVVSLVQYTTTSNLRHGGVPGEIRNAQKTIPVILSVIIDEWYAALKATAAALAGTPAGR